VTDYLLLPVSIAVFISGLYLARRTGTTQVKIISLLVLAALFFLMHDLYIVSRILTGKWFDESVLFHLHYGVDGAGLSEYWQLIAASLVFIIGGIVGSYFVFSASKPEPGSCGGECSNSVSYLLVLAGIGLIPGNIQLADALVGEQGTDFYSYYRTPRITGSPDVRRNVVFIYAEGLERTHFDENIFPGLTRWMTRSTSSRAV